MAECFGDGAVSRNSGSDSSTTRYPSASTMKHAKGATKKFSRQTSNPAKDQERQENTLLFEIFQKYYEQLNAITRSCPNTIANKLFSKNMISVEVLDQVITGQDSSGKKASTVLFSVCSQIQANPQKLLDFIEVLKEESIYDDIAREIASK